MVVDFPLVPVIAATGPAMYRAPSSSSPITGTPAARAATSSGACQDTPGETHHQPGAGEGLRRLSPSSSRTPISASFNASSGSSACGFRSVATTVLPRPARNRAAAIPDRARPTTTTGFPSRSMVS